MVSIIQVASYILNNHQDILKENNKNSLTKLQKLSYYSQAWHYVWSGSPLTEDDFEAWQFGPVSPKLFFFVKAEGWHQLSKQSFKELSLDQKESIDLVVSKYGSLKAVELTELSHNERPWLNSRNNLLPHEKSKSIIDKELIYTYHESQLNEQKA